MNDIVIIAGALLIQIYLLTYAARKFRERKVRRRAEIERLSSDY